MLWCDHLSPTLLGSLCVVIGVIHLFLYRRNGRKKYPKLIKSLNWFLLAGVYIADAVLHPADNTFRDWFTIAFFLLLLSEIAYHGDALIDMYQVVKGRIKAYE